MWPHVKEGGCGRGVGKLCLPPVVELALYLWPSTNELWTEKRAGAAHRHRTWRADLAISNHLPGVGSTF